MDRGYPRVTVSKKCERFIKGGHIWVYHDEIKEIDGSYENGDIVDVLTEKGRYLGSGYINDSSKIRVRIISKNANDRFDTAFYRRRVEYAVDYRLTVMGEDFSSCRLIFGEADGFPGLTVDQFESVLVAQVLSLGTDRVKETIFRLLVEVLRERGYTVDAIYERNDVKVRELEGLREYKGFYPLDGLRTDLSGEVGITENGIRYAVDYVNGQKTGFFLDQKYNRRAVAKIARGKRVLDCFTHTGAFALNAATVAEQNDLTVGTSTAAGTTPTSHSSATELKNAEVAKLVRTASGIGSPRTRRRTIPTAKRNASPQT